jgi:hypothetical protein
MQNYLRAISVVRHADALLSRKAIDVQACGSNLSWDVPQDCVDMRVY